MFENKLLRSLIAAASWWITGSALSADLDLEPCINGAVSPSGAFSSAQLERSANGYQNWGDYSAYYLFAVSATYLDSPFDIELPDSQTGPD